MELPLVEDVPGQIPSLMLGVEGSATAGPVQAGAAAGIGAPEHNTHLWVAGVMLVALIAIAFLHISGFRFSTDVGITRG